MSELRKQLDQAKADYQSARYPGDLAADVLIGRRSRSRSFWRMAVPIAAAACVAIAVGVAWRGSERIEHFGGSHSVTLIFPPATTESATYDTPAVATIPEPETLPESPTFPTDMPLVPTKSYSSFPSPVSMPSINTSTDPSTTEKEPA